MSKEDSDMLPENLNKKHIATLDGWRGIAIILVLFGHFTVFWLGDVSRTMGMLGVEFFFALSGLLISKILFVDHMPLSQFVTRRVARIFPVFYLFLFVVMMFKMGIHNHYQIWDMIYSALFVRNYFSNASPLPISHLWSVMVEVHCYIVLGIVSVIVGKREGYARWLVTMLAFCCLIFMAFYMVYPPKNDIPIYFRSEYTGFSVFVSSAFFLWLRHWNISAGKYLAIIAAGIGSLNFIVPSSVLPYVLTPLLLAVSVNTLSAAPVWVADILSSRILKWFALCSYSLYIWQQPFYLWQEHIGGISSVEALSGAVVVSVCSFYFYERPMRKRIAVS